MTLRVIWTILPIFVFQAQGDFDCRREGLSCNGGKCNVDTGQCSRCYMLSPPRQGFNCGLITEYVDKGGCDAKLCENGGTCFEDDVTSCYCHEDYYGENCSHRRYEAVSTTIDMMINIEPLPAFNGVIYISGHKSCRLLPLAEADGIPDHWNGYYGAFSHENSECGNAWENATTKVRHVTVQYKENYLTGLDLQLTLTTTLDVDGVEINTASFSVTADEVLLQQEIITSTFNPVTMAITTKDGALLPDTPVSVGTVLVFTFSVPENDFAALRLETITVNNTVSDDTDLTLVNDGCLVDDMLSLIDGTPGPTNPGVKSTIKFKLRTFKFSASDVIALTFVIKVCIVDSDCEQATCPASARRRRSLDEDETVLNTVIRVRDPQESVQDDVDSNTSSREQSSRIFTITVTSEGIVLAVFSVVLALLARRFCQRKSKHSRETQTELNGHFPYYLMR